MLLLRYFVQLRIAKVNTKTPTTFFSTCAGFPGVVLKIPRPDIKLTLLDSLNKRLTFLDTVLNDTGLDAELVHSRAEEGGEDKLYREKFDIAVSRADMQG